LIGGASAGLTRKERRNAVADEQLIKILEEIRDLQKEHLAGYKEAVKNQQEGLDLQKRAVRRQKLTMAVYVFFMLALLGFLVWSSLPHAG
jgi:hypothetical protein